MRRLLSGLKHLCIVFMTAGAAFASIAFLLLPSALALEFQNANYLFLYIPYVFLFAYLIGDDE